MFNFNKLYRSLFLLIILSFSQLAFAYPHINPSLYDKIQGAWQTSINGQVQLIKFTSNFVEVTLNEEGVISKLRGTYYINKNIMEISWDNDIFGLASYTVKLIPMSPEKFKVIDSSTGEIAYFLKKS